MRTTIVTMVALLAGCAPALRGAHEPPPSEVQELLDITIEQWRASELPWTDACERERALAIYHEVDDAEMRYQTGYCASGSIVCEETRVEGDPEATTIARAEAGCAYGVCSAGSMHREHSQPWPLGLWSTWRVRVIVSRYLTEELRRDAVTHEYSHALSACSGLGADEAHREVRIWGSGGVVERAGREWRRRWQER